MPATNTVTSYGGLTRLLHWLTALLVLTAFPLGFIANRTPLADPAALNRVYTLFSLHKTIGILALAVGLLRILNAVVQPRPAPLHPGRRFETILASATHWTLTIALVAVPLSGWIAHAATDALAPIRWPLGQSLPFIPKSAALAEIAGGIHWTATKLFAAAILLHVAGALKHALVDRDATLARMLTGRSAGTGSQSGQTMPALSAFAIWTLAVAFGLTLGLERADRLAAAPPPEWPVTSGIVAMIDEASGTPFGQIAAWNATLTLDPHAPAAKGTLDLFAALDSLDGDGASAVLDRLAIPILQFSSSVSGTLPVLAASGTLDVGGLSEAASIAIEPDDTGARIFATLPIPGTPGIVVTVDLRAERP